jgi:SP family general alpha glucoside:H+ symporter-like MFS transporter
MLSMHLIADRYGRKVGFYVLWVVLAAGIAAESFGKTWKTWLAAKLFSGFAVGSVQVRLGWYLNSVSWVFVVTDHCSSC